MHNIFSDRFYGHREPAWHRLGNVSQDQESARQAWRTLGRYGVILADVSVPDFPDAEGAYKAIVRRPTKDDKVARIFGIVTDGFELVSADDLVDLWDEFTGAYVETMFALGVGERFGITTKLGTFSIRGDEHEDYLLADLPMTGTDAISIVRSPVRVVCQNTLIMAHGSATEKYRITHEKGAKVRTGEWLADMFEKSRRTTKAMVETFDAMARTNVSEGVAKSTLRKVYANLTVKENAPERVLKVRRERLSVLNDMAKRNREAVLELFLGAGTGMSRKSCAGTAFGLYNAVVEAEDYKRGGGDGAAASALFGSRAETKARAFGLTSSLVKVAA